MKFSKHDSLMRSELVNSSIFKLIQIRLPWLVVGFLGALLASVIVSRFELSIRENIALAFFIPILTNMADSVGSQTETIFIRALTDLKFNITRYVLRELLVGAMMGSILGVLAGVFAYILSGTVIIGIIVCISLLLAMMVSTTLACVTPLVLKAIKKDPAVGSGPFTTSIQDVVSLIVYFLVAIVLLPKP